uniref:Uncharacterized protein n=1 Tax=Rhizophora mucronata TaxID=61149 RepID=A0A2P2P7M9_RHIMU
MQDTSYQELRTHLDKDKVNPAAILLVQSIH